MRNLRKSMLAFMLILTVGIVAGCGMKEDDAKSYVQATLDASYKAEFKDYMKQTDSKEKDVQKLYDTNIDTMMTSSGVETSGISDELSGNYRQLFIDLLKQAKYSVGEVKKVDGGFEVKVKVEPFQVFDGVEDELMKAVEKEAASMTSVPSTEEMNELVMQKMYDILLSKMEAPEYGEAEDITVHIEKDSDGVYNIKEEDLTGLDEAMFAM